MFEDPRQNNNNNNNNHNHNNHNHNNHNHNNHNHNHNNNNHNNKNCNINHHKLHNNNNNNNINNINNNHNVSPNSLTLKVDQGAGQTNIWILLTKVSIWTIFDTLPFMPQMRVDFLYISWKHLGSSVQRRVYVHIYFLLVLCSEADPGLIVFRCLRFGNNTLHPPPRIQLGIGWYRRQSRIGTYPYAPCRQYLPI